MKSVRVLAVVQARLGSTRLPGKALRDVAGRPMLAHVLSRTKAIRGVDQIVLATTQDPSDEALVDFARSIGVVSVRGSVNDVLDRFRAAALAFPADAILRITGDCPLIDPGVSALVVEKYVRHSGAVDYVSNVEPRTTYPDGLDTEIFSRDALEHAWRGATLPLDREHVTPYLRNPRHGFRLLNVEHPQDLSAHRWTVDEERDLQFVREVYKALAPDGERMFGMNEILELLRSRPELADMNAGIRRNEGFERSRLADFPAPRGQDE